MSSQHVVHGLPPMTTAELSELKCGHCQHSLTYHATRSGGTTFCAICSCHRSPGEDILKPHSFDEVPHE